MPSLPRGHLLIYLPAVPEFCNSLESRAFFRNDWATNWKSAPSRLRRNEVEGPRGAKARNENKDPGRSAEALLHPKPEFFPQPPRQGKGGLAGVKLGC